MSLGVALSLPKTDATMYVDNTPYCGLCLRNLHRNPVRKMTLEGLLPDCLNALFEIGKHYQQDGQSLANHTSHSWTADHSRQHLWQLWCRSVPEFRMTLEGNHQTTRRNSPPLINAWIREYGLILSVKSRKSLDTDRHVPEKSDK